MVHTFVIWLFREFDSEPCKFPGYLLTSKHAASLNIQIPLSCHSLYQKLDSECNAFYKAQRLYHLFLTSSVRLILGLQHSNGRSISWLTNGHEFERDCSLCVWSCSLIHCQRTWLSFRCCMLRPSSSSPCATPVPSCNPRPSRPRVHAILG